MTVTGNVSQNQPTLQRVYDHAFRRAGIPAQLITSEYLETAKSLLDLTLSELVTVGVTLWTNDHIYMGMRAGLPTLTLPDGTLEVERAVLLQTTTTAAALTGTSPTWLAETSSVVAAQFIGVKVSTAGIYDIAVDASSDGITYAEVASFNNQQLFTAQWNWLEITPDTDEVLYFRVRETSSASFPVTAIQLAVGASERELAVLGQGDYANLPNKRTRGTVTSYWTDRRVDGPVMYLWNAPDTGHEDYMIAVWRKRHIMDVGAMGGRIEVPQRWMDAIIWDLAWRLCAEIPEAKKQALEIKPFADLAKMKIMPSESDGGIVSMLPDVSMYTA